MPRRGENIRKRKDGRWEARYIIGYRENGRAQYKYLYGKTYADVKAAKQNAVGNKQTVVTAAKQTSCKTTVAEVTHMWLAGAKCLVKESTYARYAFITEKYIIPGLGVKPLLWLSNDTLDGFTQNLLNSGKHSGGGLAPKTVTDILAVFKLILKYANTYCGITLNLNIRCPKQPPANIEVISPNCQEYLETFLVDSDDLIRLGMLFSLYTGLRIGELCSLRWEDFNFTDNTVSVERTINRIQNTDPNAETKTKIIIDRPKTDCSIRTIPMPDFFMNYIKKYRGADGTYFLTGTAEYIEPRSYFNMYRRVLKECGLEAYTFHALRHTFATRCVEKGFDIKSLSEILGHSDVTTTLKRYVHPSMELKRSQMNKLETPSFCGRK